jgi:hypothetical protein
MAAVVKRFGPITCDLAARDYNAQSPNYLAPCTGPEGPLPRDPHAYAIDSFDVDWARLSTFQFRREGYPGLLWLNPEFRDIAPWLTKCRMEASRGANILALSPAAVGSNWFSNIVAWDADVYFLKPRLSFISGETYNKDCMLSHFVRPQYRSMGIYELKNCRSQDHRYMMIWNWQTDTIECQWEKNIFW